jgi:hypothetical protein
MIRVDRPHGLSEPIERFGIAPRQAVLDTGAEALDRPVQAGEAFAEAVAWIAGGQSAEQAQEGVEVPGVLVQAAAITGLRFLETADPAERFAALEADHGIVAEQVPVDGQVLEGHLPVAQAVVDDSVEQVDDWQVGAKAAGAVEVVEGLLELAALKPNHAADQPADSLDHGGEAGVGDPLEMAFGSVRVFLGGDGQNGLAQLLDIGRQLFHPGWGRAGQGAGRRGQAQAHVQVLEIVDLPLPRPFRQPPAHLQGQAVLAVADDNHQFVAGHSADMADFRAVPVKEGRLPCERLAKAVAKKPAHAGSFRRPQRRHQLHRHQLVQHAIDVEVGDDPVGVGSAQSRTQAVEQGSQLTRHLVRVHRLAVLEGGHHLPPALLRVLTHQGRARRRAQ